MTNPCDKGPQIEGLTKSLEEERKDRKADSSETHRKLDKVIDVLSAVAVQGERVAALEKKSIDIEARMRKLEPLRFIFPLIKWTAGIGSVLVAAWMIYLLGLGDS